LAPRRPRRRRTPSRRPYKNDGSLRQLSGRQGIASRPHPGAYSNSLSLRLSVLSGTLYIDTGEPVSASGEQAETFCPSCGTKRGPADRFCSACGASLSVGDDDPAEQGATSEQAQQTLTGSPASSHKRLLAIGGLAAAVIAVAVVVVVLVLGVFSGPSAAQRHQSATAALRARLLTPFQNAMQQRTKFFTDERSFVAAMSDANQKIGTYKERKQSVETQDKQIEASDSAQQSACSSIYSSVPCPSPTYPKAPSAPEVHGDISKLRSVVSHLTGLKAEVLAVSPPPEMKVLFAQFESAITTLLSNAQADADTLQQGITEPEPGKESTGSVEEQKIGTLQPDQAVPAIRIMNREAVSLINQMGLPIGQYDVPGGTDIDPTDHSTAS
jgi:zinc-ribbon domain